MVTKAEEYLAGKHKKVKLPSILPNGKHPVFIIRKPPMRVIIELLRILDVSLDVDKNPEVLERGFMEAWNSMDVKEKIAGFIDLLLPACVVEPRITLDPNEKDAIYIDDLDMEDQFKLLEEIWDFAGLSKEAEKQRNL